MIIIYWSPNLRYAFQLIARRSLLTINAFGCAMRVTCVIYVIVCSFSFVSVGYLARFKFKRWNFSFNWNRLGVSHAFYFYPIHNSQLTFEFHKIIMAKSTIHTSKSQGQMIEMHKTNSHIFTGGCDLWKHEFEISFLSIVPSACGRTLRPSDSVRVDCVSHRIF